MKIKSMTVVIAASIMFLLLNQPAARADSSRGPVCLTAVPLSEEAEHQDGGSKFSPTTHKETEHKKMAGEHREDHGPKVASLAKHEKKKHDEPGDFHKEEKEASHGLHKGLQGGVFFMAPNKIHHVEGVYSEQCGFSLVIYNAYTKPVKVNRFHAFVKYIPEDEDQQEAVRFLLPTADGSLLQGPKAHGITGPYEIEVYVKFPENDEPALFNYPGTHGT